MPRLILFLQLSFFIISCSQNKSNTTSLNRQDSIVFVQKCISFIKQIKNQELSDTNFILLDKPFNLTKFDLFNCTEQLLSDTSFFTKSELSLIKEKQFPTISKWTVKMFSNIRIISNDTINNIFKDRSKWWTYFYKNYGRSFKTFSVPFFFRNDTYCLFYSDNSCGGLCGEGRLILYQKVNNKWIEIKSYCNWVS